MPVSRAVRREDGALDFTSGPLKRLAELEALRSVFRRERRATAVLPLHGKEHKINLSFEIEQETGSSTGAGSPPEPKAAEILLHPRKNDWFGPGWRSMSAGNRPLHKPLRKVPFNTQTEAFKNVQGYTGGKLPAYKQN